jgi:hypothetical protein
MTPEQIEMLKPREMIDCRYGADRGNDAVFRHQCRVGRLVGRDMASGS